MESCLSFFKTYLPATRRWFVIESVLFWIWAALMLLLLSMTPASVIGRTNSMGRLRKLLVSSTAYIFWSVLALQTTLFITIVHVFVPEQVLRAQAGRNLEESHWTFGQSVGMWIWFPVVSEFGFVLVCKLTILLACGTISSLTLHWQSGGKRVWKAVCRSQPEFGIP
jgi:hypothetical protein